jgi:malonyl-CoA O-methyltransferase
MDHRLTLTGRLADGLRRRVRYAWWRLRRGRRRPPVEAALEWLLVWGPQDDAGLPINRPGPSPQLVGLCLETLLWLGCREPARRWAARLVALQRPDGSLPGPDQAGASLSDTASTLRGWLATLDDVPELEQPARRAAAWLRSHAEHVISHTSSLIPHLFPLLDAGRRWPESDFFPFAEKLLDDFCRAGDSRDPDGDPEELLLDWAEAQCRRGNLPAARDILQVLAHRPLWSAATCRRFGRVFSTKTLRGSSPEICPPIPSGRPKSGDGSPHSKPSPGPGLVRGQPATNTALARLAALGYQVGLRGPADRAMQLLQRRQNSSGGFPRDAGGTLLSRRRPEDPLAVKYYLDAARLRVLAAFETVGQDLPATIDPADGRVQAAADWMGRLPASARVADVGCGKGRFLKHLAARFPGTELIGVDISKVMLAQLPPGVRALEGSLLRLPLADGTLDGAMAVESLEHALLPEQAIGELCRVVRPGGSVLVIDKHRAKQPLSLHDPWERWFTPQELSVWLGRWCDEVTVSSVAHLEGRPGRDLFLAASGRRRRNG